MKHVNPIIISEIKIQTVIISKNKLLILFLKQHFYVVLQREKRVKIWQAIEPVLLELSIVVNSKI